MRRGAPDASSIKYVHRHVAERRLAEHHPLRSPGRPRGVRQPPGASDRSRWRGGAVLALPRSRSIRSRALRCHGRLFVEGKGGSRIHRIAVCPTRDDAASSKVGSVISARTLASSMTWA